ncbi:MAG: outer membrane beta-barrel domain-containing protein [Polyangiaceae bacterium]
MAIKQAGSLNSVLVALLVALGFALTPAESLAQPDGDDAADSDDDDAAGDDDDDAAGDDDDDDDGPVAGDDDDDGGGEEPVGLDALCELDPDNCVRLNMEEYAARDVDAEMYAVQQIWALRKYRFELNPYFGATMNDQFVSHPAMGLGANFYVLDPLAIGVNGNFYQPFNSESDFNFQTSRAARVGQPLTEYSFNVNGNITYVPAYGKFAAFGDFIFHYDFYFLIGGGIISTRPIAVVDPDNRTFKYKIRPTWGFGGGMRIFFTRWLAAMLEIRDYMFLDELENPAIVPGNGPNGPLAQDPSTWLSDGTNFTNHVQAQLGISVFLPFTWEYKLPK